MIDIKRQEEAFEKLNKNKLYYELGDISTIRRGSSPRPIQDFVNKGSNNWLKITDIVNLKIDNVEQKISNEGASKGLKAVKGDIIYTNSATPGLAVLLELDEVYLNDGFLLINDVHKNIKKNFLVFYLNTMREQILKKGAGSIFTNLNKEIVSKIKIINLNEYMQQEVAKYLTSLDELIQKQEEYIEELKVQKSGYSQRIFNQKEVVYKTLGKLCTIKYGYTPSTANSENFDGGIPWVSVSDMDRKVIKNTKKTLSTIGENKNKLIKKGTLIMSFKLTVGKLAFVGEDMYSNEAIANFTKLNSISAMYLYYALENTNIEKYGSQAAQGVTLNTELLKSIQVPITPNPEKVAVLLSTIDQKIELEKEKLELLKKKKKYYLNKIFS